MEYERQTSAASSDIAQQRFAADVAAQTRYAPNGAGVLLDEMPDLAGSPALADIIGRAGDIHGNLNDIADILARHIDRILGPQPLAGAGACANKVAEPPHEMAQLRDRMANLDTAAYRIRNQVERLARL